MVMIRQLDRTGTECLTHLEANMLIQQSLTLPSLLSWDQHDGCLSLALTTRRCSRPSWLEPVSGIVTIDLRWAWRIEDASGFQYFGYSDRQCISRVIDALFGRAIVLVAVSGPFAELLIEFADGTRVIGMATSHQASEWQVRLPKRLKICSVAGALYSMDRDAVGPPSEQASAQAELR
jgi:hypothetical protein